MSLKSQTITFRPQLSGGQSGLSAVELQLQVNELSTDAVNNSSTIQWSCYWRTVNNSKQSHMNGNQFTINIGGEERKFTDGYSGAAGSTLNWIKLQSEGTVVVNHDADGTKTIPISFRYYNNRFIVGTPNTIAEGSGSATLQLTDIPREAKIERFISGDTVTLLAGTPQEFTLAPVIPNFTYTIEFECGDFYQVDEGVLGSSILDKISINLLDSDIETIATQYNEVASATATVTVTTYNNLGVQIGAPQSRAFLFTFDNELYYPTVTWGAITSSMAPAGVVQQNYKSYTTYTINFTSECKYNALPTKIIYSFGTLPTDTSPYVEILDAATSIHTAASPLHGDEVPLYVTFVDSRGNNNSYIYVLNIKNIIAPSFSNLSISRYKDGVPDLAGTNVHLGFTLNLDPALVNAGPPRPSVMYGPAGQYPLNNTAYFNDDNMLVSSTGRLITFKENTSYEFAALVWDAFSQYAISPILTIGIASPLIDILMDDEDNKIALAIGQIAPEGLEQQINTPWKVISSGGFYVKDDAGEHEIATKTYVDSLLGSVEDRLLNLHNGGTTT